METRKTTEAEEMMTAVRNEQEARCSLNKNYTSQFSKLRSYQAGKNFDYEINAEGVGMLAKAKSGQYTLEIPSYLDGRICCSSGCDKLNKNYPTCDELKAKTDYEAGNAECEAPVSSCNNDHQEGAEASNTPCECGGPRIEEWTCSGTEWVKTLVQDCKDPQACKKCENEEGLKRQCEDDYDDQDVYGAKGTWNGDSCKCECSGGAVFDESLQQCMCKGGKEWNGTECVCPEGQEWDGSKCSCPEGLEWDGNSRCVCPQGKVLDGGQCICEDNEDGYLQQACEQGNGVGTAEGEWDEQECECRCLQKGSHYEKPFCVLDCDDSLAQFCMDPPQHIIAYDNYDYPVYDHEKGTWKEDTCECECPYDRGKRLPLINGMCTYVCEGHAAERALCENGSESDRQQGIAVPGYFNPYTCGCNCPTNYGAGNRKNGNKVVSCYRDNCVTGTSRYGWESDKHDCELAVGFVQCPGGWYMAQTTYGKCSDKQLHYYKGQWNAEKCQCNCPQGTKLWGGVVSNRQGHCVGTGRTVNPDNYIDVEVDFDRDEGYDWVSEVVVDDDGGDAGDDRDVDIEYY